MQRERALRREGAPAEEPELAPGFYRIFVRDLVLRCSIGVHAHERDAPQRVRLNVSLLVREWRGPLRDSISKVLSYERVVDEIRALVKDRHINLVESLAEDIAESCLAHRQVAGARVRVEKLDLYEDAGGVGVEIERRRAGASASGLHPLARRGGSGPSDPGPEGAG